MGANLLLALALSSLLFSTTNAYIITNYVLQNVKSVWFNATPFFAFLENYAIINQSMPDLQECRVSQTEIGFSMYFYIINADLIYTRPISLLPLYYQYINQFSPPQIKRIFHSNVWYGHQKHCFYRSQMLSLTMLQKWKSKNWRLWEKIFSYSWLQLCL